MQRIEPAKANNVPKRRWRNLPGLVRLPEYQAERRRQGSELRSGHECQIDLQRAGEQEYAVNPRAGEDIHMMQGGMLLVHIRRPVDEDVRHLVGIAYGKGEIDVRPLVLASVCRRAS